MNPHECHLIALVYMILEHFLGKTFHGSLIGWSIYGIKRCKEILRKEFSNHG